MTGDFAQDTSLNMSAAQPPASSRPSTTATGSPSRLTSSTSKEMAASVPVDASALRSHASATSEACASARRQVPYSRNATDPIDSAGFQN